MSLPPDSDEPEGNLADDRETVDEVPAVDDVDPMVHPQLSAGSGDAVDITDPLGVDAETGPNPKRGRALPFWVEVPLLMALALVIAVVIKTFLVQAFFIPSGSMEHTLEVDDRILVNKLAYRFGDPGRGDVVVFDSGRSRDENLLEAVRRNLAEAIGLSAPESDFIKRVIGLPGEEILIRDNRVFIDGVAIDEPYLPAGVVNNDFGPEVVPKDHYFMMGDNRQRSSDSRSDLGPVHIDRFVGRAFVIVWPPGSWGGL